MKQLAARVASVHVGQADELRKEEQSSITVDFDGIAGDRHQSFTRVTWQGDKQKEGTLRRNERQWSAVSVEEIAEIGVEMALDESLTAADLGANLCLSGIPQLSRLPRGSTLEFPSGAVLMVEEYNPPCLDMGEYLASEYAKRSGDTLSPTAFSKAAKLTRGIVGVVEVPGVIYAGDEIRVRIHETPPWLVHEGGDAWIRS